MNDSSPAGRLVVGGLVCDRRGTRQGWAVAEDGAVVEKGYGPCPERPDVTGYMVSDVLNMHTHCADYGLRIPEGMGLQELVAPPNGLKHRYLRETPPDVLRESMSRFSDDSMKAGSLSFVDFREGGEEGCRLLRSASPGAVILGRPVSKELDTAEVEGILDVADGIGISSISDMDHRYIEAVADIVRERRKVFAIHASERVREDIDFVLSLDPAFVVHMCEATDSDLAKCAEAEVPIVVCPTSNMYFGKAPPIARAQAAGADLALGTDNGMLCPPDMFSEAAAFAEAATMQGGDPEQCFAAMSKVTGKILNAVKSNSGAVNPDGMTVVPARGASITEALRDRGSFMSLGTKEVSQHGIQEHTGSD